MCTYSGHDLHELASIAEALASRKAGINDEALDMVTDTLTAHMLMWLRKKQRNVRMHVLV